MLKPLLKKQLQETAAFFYLNNKNGRRRSPLAVVGFAALMLYAVAAIVAMFYIIADTLCVALVGGGLTWVYFALIGVIAAAFACVGSAFAAKTKLYEAKDNDLLLSMPVKPWEVLFSRLLGLYLLTLFFSSVVFVPAVACYFLHFGFAVLPAVLLLLITLILPLGALAVSCLLGWGIAVVTARIRSKNLVTMLFAVAFLAVYFVVYSKMMDYLSYVMAHGEAVGARMKTALWPFYQMGLAATGNIAAFAAFVGVFLAAFALVYFLLSKTFFRLATTKRGGGKVKYREKGRGASSVFSALFRRESLRFFKNPMVMLNCSLGSVLLVALPVLALFNLDFCREVAAVDADGVFALILVLVACGVVAMNIVTASSVSLEGETLWQLQSFPVEPLSVFAAKLALHIAVTAIPALVGTTALCILFGISFAFTALCLFTVTAYVLFCATSGLAVNLKMPNLHWTNETVAVKQSMSALVSMFVNIGAVGLFVGGYFLFGKYLPEAAYLAVCALLLAIASALLFVWLKKRGVRIFSGLQA
ncbi:MAG: hypothetical protein IJ514_07240 [Clostridia bacterium]|nr:hypothetical protein [Clostridia bacterium]